DRSRDLYLMNFNHDSIAPECEYRPNYQFFLFIDTAPTEIYTLSLHDALPILLAQILTQRLPVALRAPLGGAVVLIEEIAPPSGRSEEHTSELQSRGHLVCRLLLEKKKNSIYRNISSLALHCGVAVPRADPHRA